MFERFRVKLKQIKSDWDFIINDTTSGYGYTRDERIKIMEENTIRERILSEAFTRECDGFMLSPEYVNGTKWKRFRMRLKYTVINKRAEMSFYTAEGVLWYKNGKTRVRISEHFPENGKPISELIENAIRFEADNPEAAVVTEKVPDRPESGSRNGVSL